MKPLLIAFSLLLAGQDLEVRLRGPVHEAYATTGESRMPVETSQPPQPLAEAVPKVYPGEGAWWIPGYWDLDLEERAWTWVTGTWRVPPAGHVWISGYWRQVTNGNWQRVPGVWFPSLAGQARLTYVAPPSSRAPQVSGPVRPVRGDDPNLVNIPGEWQLVGNHLQWVSGKRVGFGPGMGWSVGRLSWTPAGALPVSGHADQSFDSRGWAFAPVRARPGTAWEPSWIWTQKAWVETSWKDPAGFYRLGDHHSTLWIDAGLVSAIDAARQRGDPFLEPLSRKAASALELEQAQFLLRERNMGRQPWPARVLTRENAAIQTWLQPAKGETTPEVILKREQQRAEYFAKQAKVRQRLEQGIKRVPATVTIEAN